MADMRHRDGKVKIMHTIIGDYGRVLRQMAELDEVESILTGTISPSKSYKESLTFQYFTDNGLKLLAKTTTAVQEIFIVTSTPDVLLDELQKMGYVDSQRDDVKHGAQGRKSGARKNRRTQETPGTEQTAVGPTKSKHAKEHHQAGGNRTTEADPLTLKQRLDPAAIAALLKIKESATPKMRPEPSTNSGSSARHNDLSRKGQKNANNARQAAEPEDFASLFAPPDEEESFEQLLNKSKLDPKFFK